MKRIILCISIALISTYLLSQEEEIIGESYYDLQTNGSCQNRIYLYEDGTIGTTWTYGLEWMSFPDRGTGYNYYNGTTWQSWPTERIESMRTGWPSYAPFGEEGEIIISHLQGNGADSGLLINKRPIKGQGNWAESLFEGPENDKRLFWPRMVTGGTNHNSIYILALTAPTSYGGSVYHGLNGALLYSRSTNGGETWNIQNQILPGMDSTEYNGFTGDCYAFAEPRENYVAFVVGSYKNDMFLMKSTDFGQTFEKTIIWDNPYDTILPADTFYCVDGSMAVALDADGKAHVVFGIISAYYVNEWKFNREVDGVGYWNEDRSTFSSNINALNPAGGPGSEMISDYNLIGWSQDLNGNGQIDFLYIGIYGILGVSSMVQIVIDQSNAIFLVYSSVTESFSNGYENYRRLWFRSSLDGGNSWGQFYHFAADDPFHIFDDFFFPSCASNSDENIYCILFLGNEPCLNGPCSEAIDWSRVDFLKIPKDEIVGITSNKENPGFTVSQNFPNPFTESTIIKVVLSEPSDVTLDILNLLGQKVAGTKRFNGKPGSNTLKIERDGLAPGVYYYNVSSGEYSLTNKMIIH
jgi:hypothetical protein